MTGQPHRHLWCTSRPSSPSPFHPPRTARPWNIPNSCTHLHLCTRCFFRGVPQTPPQPRSPPRSLSSPQHTSGIAHFLGNGSRLGVSLLQGLHASFACSRHSVAIGVDGLQEGTRGAQPVQVTDFWEIGTMVQQSFCGQAGRKPEGSSPLMPLSMCYGQSKRRRGMGLREEKCTNKDC